jgi:O-acetyl-ADP-ribose deacetylase (regulator of RNase III)
MKIDYRIGDMFKGGHNFIAHGCNAQGVMGSGVAKLVKSNYYYAYVAYRQYYEDYGLKLGEVIYGSVSHDSTPEKPSIFNCITQNKYGTDQRYANYGAIQQCVRIIDQKMSYTPARFEYMNQVAFPMIGAGLAGGDWGIISDIIESNSHNFKPVVYDFTP